MREVKFRGFNRKNSEWIYGFYLQNRGAHFVCPDEFANGKSWDDYEIDPDTLGQFTGLQDKNGTDVYEGDIISNSWCFKKKSVVRFGKYQHLNAQREYENGDLGFYMYHLDEFKRKVERNDIQFFFCNEDKGEVIGNIYQNKELLENG